MKNLPPKAFPSIRELQDHADFWMSDHARFWYHKEENEFMTFPSILLTDTGRTFSVIWVKKKSATIFKICQLSVAKSKTKSQHKTISCRLVRYFGTKICYDLSMLRVSQTPVGI